MFTYLDSMSLLQKVKSGMESPGSRLRKPLWVYCSGHTRVKGNDQADGLAGEATFIVVCVSELLKCWGASDTSCGYKARDITLSIAWRGEVLKEKALDDVRSKDERRPSSVRQTLELFQRQRLGKLLRDGVERIWAFPSIYIQHIHTVFSTT